MGREAAIRLGGSSRSWVSLEAATYKGNSLALSDCFSSSGNGGVPVLVSLTYLQVPNLTCLQWVYFPTSSEEAWQREISGKRRNCVNNSDLRSACNRCRETDLLLNHIGFFLWT